MGTKLILYIHSIKGQGISNRTTQKFWSTRGPDKKMWIFAVWNLLVAPFRSLQIPPARQLCHKNGEALNKKPDIQWENHLYMVGLCWIVHYQRFKNPHFTPLKLAIFRSSSKERAMQGGRPRHSNHRASSDSFQYLGAFRLVERKIGNLPKTPGKTEVKTIFWRSFSCWWRNQNSKLGMNRAVGIHQKQVETTSGLFRFVMGTYLPYPTVLKKGQVRTLDRRGRVTPVKGGRIPHGIRSTWHSTRLLKSKWPPLQRCRCEFTGCF